MTITKITVMRVICYSKYSSNRLEKHKHRLFPSGNHVGVRIVKRDIGSGPTALKVKVKVNGISSKNLGNDGLGKTRTSPIPISNLNSNERKPTACFSISSLKTNISNRGVPSARHAEPQPQVLVSSLSPISILSTITKSIQNLLMDSSVVSLIEFKHTIQINENIINGNAVGSAAWLESKSKSESDGLGTVDSKNLTRNNGKSVNLESRNKQNQRFDRITVKPHVANTVMKRSESNDTHVLKPENLSQKLGSIETRLPSILLITGTNETHHHTPHTLQPLMASWKTKDTVLVEFRMRGGGGETLRPVKMMGCVDFYTRYCGFLTGVKGMILKVGEINEGIRELKKDEGNGLSGVALDQSLGQKQTHKVPDKDKKSDKKKANVKQKQIEIKSCIDPHDLSVKVTRIKGFMERGVQCKVCLIKTRRGGFEELYQIIRKEVGLENSHEKNNPNKGGANKNNAYHKRVSVVGVQNVNNRKFMFTLVPK